MAVKYLSHLETLNINMQGYELQNAVIHTLTNNTRPINPNVGQVMYNTDNQTLELWDGVNWSSVSGDITSITITTGVGLQGGVVGVTGAVTGSISLNHLGLEDLVDPNKDSIFYWNDLTKKSEFLDIGDGLLINSGVLSNTIINNDQLINGSGYITADSSDTLTNKSGNISQWTNDVGYITDGNTNWNNTYGFITGINWDEITGNQLDINLSGFNNDSGFTTFDGDYNSLSNLPTIPTNNNQLINGAGYITTGNDGWVNTYGFITGVNWDEIGGLQSDINLSGFTNDVGFVSGDEFDSSGTYLNLRAQATTKGDVGLGNVENISLSTYTGNGGSLDNQYIINSEGYITGINWDGIGGTQSDINLSGFTNDIGFSTFDGDYNSLTNIPTYTQGSIIFADSDGSLTENNSQLYWDNVNNRLGIGTTTPNDKLDIDGDIRVKRTNRKPTHEDVLTSDFVSVGSVSFYTDDWVKVKVIGRGDTGVNKSFAEYLIYYDGTNYNIESLNNIVIGDNSGFPLLRMNGSNLEIKNRDSVNAGNYLIYFDDFISQTLFSGKTYRVEDFPLIWINDLYYNTYKDNTFVPNQNISIPNQSEYDSVTSINLFFKNVTTDFTNTLLNKFSNLTSLDLMYNQISLIEVNQLYNLTYLNCGFNVHIQVLDISNLVNLTYLNCSFNQISTLDISHLVNLTELYCHINPISTLDISQLANLTILYSYDMQLDDSANSQILIDLDNNGQSNGFVQSSIFGGGFITPTGIDSFNSLLSKSWNIVGLTNQITAGTTYNVEDFPKIWIDDLYYNTYKGDTFVPNVNTLMTGQTEYDTVTTINLGNQSLTTDFTNTLLNKFSNLVDLRCNNNLIPVLDVSQLVDLRVLICNNNQISILDTSQLSDLRTLFCQFNQLATLDVSQSSSLTNFWCFNNQLTTLDVSNTGSLLILYCQSNQLTALDLSQSISLTDLRCFDNQIATLDVSQCVNLDDLRCYNNQLDAAANSQILVDLDNNGLSNGYLQSSIFGGGFITPTGIDSFNNLLSKSWNIISLTNQINAGTTYNVEDFPLIWIDDLYYNTYKGDTFVPSVNTLMTGQVEYDSVTTINLNTQSLTTDFTSELLNKFTSLTDLRCGTNQIEILDVTNLVNLTYLHCGINQLTVLDVLNKTSLTFLNCSSNNISVLETQNLTLLTNLICFSNSISVLDITNLNSVTYIHCSLNNITTLNATNLTLLRDFRCFNNNLTSLTLSNNIALEELRCYTNSISNLDLSDAIELNTLSCQVNNITDLDFSSNTKLTFIECFSNQLDNLVNSQILIDLDTNGLSNGYLNSSIFGGGSLTAAGQTAKANLQAKGWNIIGI